MSSRANKYLSEYLDSRTVFVIDFLLSVLSSVAVLLILNYISGSAVYNSLFFGSVWLVSSAVASFAAMLVFRSYKLIIRHLSVRDLVWFVLVVVVKFILMAATLTILCKDAGSAVVIAVLCDSMLTLALLLVVRLGMIIVYDAYRRKVSTNNDLMRLLVYGTSDKSVAVITRLQHSPHYMVVGFLGEESQTANVRLNNFTVFSYKTEEDLDKIISSFSIAGILFATEADARHQEHALLDYCLRHRLKSLILPSVEEFAAGKLMKGNVRQVRIEDLLGREEIRISMKEIRTNFRDKVIMVTGAAGSIGSELCRQLASFDVRKIILFDNAETPMHYIRLELEERFPDLEFVPIIGDVRMLPRLDFAFREHHPQIVFHAAAYKHVPLMEENPCEAVLVNVDGSRNVADKCLEYGVSKMVMISTDKAVNPTNIMGCSKRLAEIYVQSLALGIEQGSIKGSTRFVTTRFGNVLGSNGSVIPRFREQIEKGGPVTVTHPDINRFFMTIPEACRLVMEAATVVQGNRICVFDMGQPVRIVDLARRMIQLSGLVPDVDIDIEFTGLRPGEKLYEEVLATAEDTDPTSHDRIRIARTRQYEYADVLPAIDRLAELSRNVSIPDMVRLMKQTVPEFKSKNSHFEIYDKEQ
ncbi:MAG: polysaccharide biosynthesis protein [Bacteroidales bacterium]|nr:polysaccharide biosynthesis protein [Bacteroidales bacterium]